MGHRNIVSLSHFTYFVQLLTDKSMNFQVQQIPRVSPGNLLNLKIHRFIRKQLFVILINKVQHVLAFNASLCYTSSQQMFKMSPVCTHARSQSLSPLADGQVNDVLLHTMLDVVETLLQLIDVVDA